MLIKVSDYIIKFLVKKKINHVFAVTGGAALHLIHSAYLSKKIKLIPTVHEQAAAMAADSYSRITKNCGAAFATSGPGATNLVTGVSGAYFDSVPVIYITGQVSVSPLPSSGPPAIPINGGSVGANTPCPTVSGLAQVEGAIIIMT